MSEFNIKVTGANEVRAKIKAMQQNLQNMSGPMKQVSVMLDRWVQKNFKGEGSKVGGWKDLSEKTRGGVTANGRLKKKGKRKYKTGRTVNKWVLQTDYTILADTGRLRSSFKPFFSKDNAGIGSELPYSKTHDEGLPEKGIPQRRILMKDREVRNDVNKILDWFLKIVIKKIGG